MLMALEFSQLHRFTALFLGQFYAERWVAAEGRTYLWLKMLSLPACFFLRSPATWSCGFLYSAQRASNFAQKRMTGESAGLEDEAVKKTVR
jgi:hypothetical protein